jgi:hypothetical protein
MLVWSSHFTGGLASTAAPVPSVPRHWGQSVSAEWAGVLRSKLRDDARSDRKRKQRLFTIRYSANGGISKVTQIEPRPIAAVSGESCNTEARLDRFFGDGWNRQGAKDRTLFSSGGWDPNGESSCTISRISRRFRPWRSTWLGTMPWIFSTKRKPISVNARYAACVCEE